MLDKSVNINNLIELNYKLGEMFKEYIEKKLEIDDKLKKEIKIELQRDLS